METATGKNTFSGAGSQRPLAAIVLCAGHGTRMKSALPKVLHRLLGQPMGCYPLRRAFESGAQRIAAVTGHGADLVEETFAASLPELRDVLLFARQEQQLGTAHAVMSAQNVMKGFSGDIFILYGDVPLVTDKTLRALVEAKAKMNAPAALVTTVPDDPSGYGRIIRDASGAVSKITEHKDASPDELKITEINAGLYLVDAAFLWDSLSRLDSNNAQHELYLTDLIALAYRRGTPAASVTADFEEVGGVNDRAELSRAAGTLQRRINLRHQKNGVAMDRPETILIDESVQIEQDVCLEAGTRLKGSTVIRSGAVIGQGSVISNSLIGSGSEILPYSILDDAVVGEGSKIGPFARLRPGTILESNVHIGNFVETKKAHIAEKSKANHLSYLGDCEIGAGTNIGAGTITCNYDGQHKHKTIIGNNVFVGSDSQFVAPVTIGDNVLVGAGSTITKDIPDDTMAIARGRQKNFVDHMKGRKPGDPR